MTRADLGEALFREGYNCSQSVFGAFLDVTGMDKKEAMRYASPFGAGFGKLREVCGAISGMTMVAGFVMGYDNPKERDGKIALYKAIQEMTAQFKERNETIICRELLHLQPGEDLPEPAVRTEEYYRSRPCIRVIRDAIEITEAYLKLPKLPEAGEE